MLRRLWARLRRALSNAPQPADMDYCACGHRRADHVWTQYSGGCRGCDCADTWSSVRSVPYVPPLRMHVPVRTSDLNLSPPGGIWIENEPFSYQPVEMHAKACVCGHKKVTHVRGVGACAEQACSCGRFLEQSPDRGDEGLPEFPGNSIPRLPPFERIFANAREMPIDVPTGFVRCTLCKGNKGCVWSEPGVANTTVYCVRCDGFGYHLPGSRDPVTGPKTELPTGRKIVLDDASERP